MDKQQEISVPEVLRRLRANAIWILLAGVIFCIGSIVITKLFITPVYESTASVYVYTNPDAQSEGSISDSDLTAAKNFLKSCENILTNSDYAQEEIFEYLEENYPHIKNLSVKQLEKMVEIKSVTDTQILTVSVKSTNPRLAKAVAEAYADTIPKEIVRATRVGGATVFEYAKLPEEPTSPSLVKNAAIGFLIGIVLMAGIVLIRWLCDSTIYTAGDVEELTDVPVIANIPDFPASSGDVHTHKWNTEDKENEESRQYEKKR